MRTVTALALPYGPGRLARICYERAQNPNPEFLRLGILDHRQQDGSPVLFADSIGPIRIVVGGVQPVPESDHEVRPLRRTGRQRCRAPFRRQKILQLLARDRKGDLYTLLDVALCVPSTWRGWFGHLRVSGEMVIRRRYTFLTLDRTSYSQHFRTPMRTTVVAPFRTERGNLVQGRQILTGQNNRRHHARKEAPHACGASWEDHSVLEGICRIKLEPADAPR